MRTPPITELLPHRPPMLLVQEVVELGEAGLVCDGRIPADNPFVEDGKAPAVFGLELAAQAAGVLEALRRIREGASGPPRAGYLVSLKRARFATPFLDADRALRVNVRTIGAIGQLAMVEAVVRDEGGAELVTGTLSVWADSEPA